MSILYLIPKQTRLFWIQSAEIKNLTGILNEPDGVIYITAQPQADAKFPRWMITDKNREYKRDQVL